MVEWGNHLCLFFSLKHTHKYKGKNCLCQEEIGMRNCKGFFFFKKSTIQGQAEQKQCPDPCLHTHAFVLNKQGMYVLSNCYSICLDMIYLTILGKGVFICH